MTRHSPTQNEVYDALVSCETKTLPFENKPRYEEKPPDTGAVEAELVHLLGLKRVNSSYERSSPIAGGAVRRRLEELAAEGKVVQVENRGGYGVSPQAKCWATPDKAKERAELHVRLAAEAVERKERIQTIRSRLHVAGFTVGAQGYDLDLDNMERLVERAGL